MTQPRIGLLAILSLAAIAQDLPVIKVTTRLVQLDVIVRDNNGPVTGLTQSDFRVLDQGKPQKVEVFQINAAAAPPPAVPASVPAFTQPGVFTNRDPAPAGPSTVILLDGIMTGVTDQLRAKQQLLKYLAKVQPQDRVAIYLLSGGVQLVQTFTGDSAMLIHALELQQWGAGNLPNKNKPDSAFTNARAVANAELASLVKAAGSTFVQSNIAGQAAQIRQECVGMVALARQLSRTPGRKNLFWYTDGFPLVKWGSEPQMYTDEVSQANHAFSDANIAVFPVDARGLLAPDMASATLFTPQFQAATGASTDPAAAVGGVGSPALRAAGEEGQDAMVYVARYTGGQAFLNGNDLTLPIQRVKQEAAVTYTLGFYPESAALDSKRHTLKVEVARKGATLQFRQDYLATPEPPETKIPEKTEITEAIWSSVNATGITLAAKAGKVNQPQPGMLRLSLSIDRDGVMLQPGDKGWTGVLAMVYDERSATGQDLGRISETLNLHYDDEHFQKLATDGIAYERLLRPSAQAAQIRVVVYDRGSGRVGSVAVKW